MTLLAHDSFGQQLLREQHVGDHAHRIGDVVVKGWCERCGGTNHIGLIVDMERVPRRTRAYVFMSCRRETWAIGARMLEKYVAKLHGEIPKSIRKKLRKMKRSRS